MIEVEVHLPTPESEVVPRIAARMRQQIVDAHTAAVIADTDEADHVVMFITETYSALCRQYDL